MGSVCLRRCEEQAILRLIPLPQPAEDVGEDGTVVFVGVAAVGPGVVELVARAGAASSAFVLANSRVESICWLARNPGLPVTCAAKKAELVFGVPRMIPAFAALPGIMGTPIGETRIAAEKNVPPVRGLEGQDAVL
jgi:hypothetical protein